MGGRDDGERLWGGQWTPWVQKQGLSSGLGQGTYLGNQALQVLEDPGWELVPESLGVKAVALIIRAHVC